MRADLLFYVFLSIFVITAIVTLLGIVGLVKIPKSYLRALFTSLILEVVAGVVALYKVEVINAIPQSESVVRDFYASIAKHEYDHAYELIDPKSDFRKKYQLDVFRTGYVDTVRITSVAIAPIVTSPENNNHEYAVYYRDEFRMPARPALDDLRDR